MKIKFSGLLAFFICVWFNAYAHAEDYKFYCAVDSQSICKVNELHKLSWKAVKPEEQIKFGYNSNATIWCKLIYQRPHAQQSFYWLFDNIHLDSVTLYKDEK